MRTYKYFIAIISILFSFSLWAESNPVPMLEQMSANIIATLKANKAALKNNKSIIHQAVKTNLLPHVDVQGMSRSVLGRNAWMKANAHERIEFSHEFTELVIRTYANPLAQYTDETVSITPLHAAPRGRFVKVQSVIHRSKGKAIPLTYSLVNISGSWKIYDLSVEGVSLLQSFRNQFASALNGGSVASLIQQMKKQHKA